MRARIFVRSTSTPQKQAESYGRPESSRHRVSGTRSTLQSTTSTFHTLSQLDYHSHFIAAPSASLQSTSWPSSADLYSQLGISQVQTVVPTVTCPFTDIFTKSTSQSQVLREVQLASVVLWQPCRNSGSVGLSLQFTCVRRSTAERNLAHSQGFFAPLGVSWSR